MMIKEYIKKLLGPKLLGVYDYFIRPQSKVIWGGAFNGQMFRRQIFVELVQKNNFSQIVETGTFMGNTTQYMSESNIPIKSVEYNERNIGYCLTRFLFNKNITISQGDSRQFLRELAKDELFVKENVFFYLDAHWNEDLPLAEELDIIFSNWKDIVIMIDDFQVPSTNYSYDDYGKGKVLNLGYLKNTKHANEYQVYFPAKDETHETSVKRGCVILTNNSSIAKQLSKMQTIRHYPDFNT